MKKIKIINRKKVDIEYEIKLSVFRILTLILIIIFLFFILKMLYFKYIHTGDVFDNSKKLITTLNINQSNQTNYLRLYNFSCIDCPLLDIYLSDSIIFNKNKSIYVGIVKRPIGYQEYKLENVDLNKYNKIVFWYREKGEIYGKSYFKK